MYATDFLKPKPVLKPKEMKVTKFHRAVREGDVEVLKEASRKDCNAPDEDGMTPTLWAAACGNLDALRLLVTLGGDPDKCDVIGNTALHWASQNGHINCVLYLVNFGVNLWALDNSLLTARKVAAMKGQRAIIRLLDEEDTKQSSKNKKHVQTLKEKATKEAQKRISAARKHPDRVPTNSKAIKGTGNVTSGEKTPLPGVAENINKPRERVNDKNDFKNVESPHVYNYEGRYNLTPTPISIRRFTNNISKINGKLSVKTKSESDLTINNAEYEITIDRPGQRNVINSPTTLVKSYNYKNKTGHSDDEEADSARGSGSRSGGSSVSSRKGPGRYRKRVQTLPYTKRASESALETFLFANGLENCLSALRNEKVDLDALFMLTENDLKELGISMGYRKKLMEALRCHQQVLKEPGGIYDSII